MAVQTSGVVMSPSGEHGQVHCVQKDLYINFQCLRCHFRQKLVHTSFLHLVTGFQYNESSVSSQIFNTIVFHLLKSTMSTYHCYLRLRLSYTSFLYLMTGQQHDESSVSSQLFNVIMLYLLKSTMFAYHCYLRQRLLNP